MVEAFNTDMSFHLPLIMSSQPSHTSPPASTQDRDDTAQRRVRRRRFTVVQPSAYENERESEGKRTGSIAVSFAVVYRDRWLR
jgi:hypothetical protein